MPFAFFSLPVKWGMEANTAHTAVIKRVLLGIVVAIPCLVILIIILSSADQIFSGGVSNTFKYLQAIFNFTLIVKIICGLIAGFYLFGLVYYIYQPKEDLSVNLGAKSGDLIVINIVLISILCVYTIFAIIQFRYLFASSGQLPYGLTYTYYARRGFFELLFLSGVNIVIILLTLKLTQKHTGFGMRLVKVLCCYLCIITFILLVSSFYRMWLYNLDGGLTRLRFLVMGFLIFEGAGLVFTFIYVIKPKFNIIAVYLCLGVIYYLLLNIVPMDAMIAKDQINRYFATGKGDIEYTLSLSSDAAPQIARLLESDDASIRNLAKRFFTVQNTKDYDKQLDWRSFNLSVEKCKQLEEALKRPAPVTDRTKQLGAQPQTITTSSTDTSVRQAEAPKTAFDITNGELPPNAKIYAAGMHSGEEQEWRINTGQPATLAMVSVNSPANPVVLVLSAYSPNVWHVGWTEGTQIIAVVVSGWNPQIVLGLPPEVPVINSTPDNVGPFDYFFMSDSEDVGEGSRVTQQLFGRNIDRAYDISKGQIRMGTTLPPNATLFSYAEPPRQPITSRPSATKSSDTLFSYVLPQIIEHEVIELENYDGMVYVEPPATNSGSLRNEAMQTGDLSGLKLPRNTKIYAVRTSHGIELDWQMDASGEPANLINVLINAPQQPVVLLLGGQRPTIWYVGWYQDSKILAVITSGKHTQKVIGLPADVPVVHYSPVLDDMESKLFDMANLLEVDGADKISQQFFGRNVDRAFKMVNGKVLIGEAVPPGLRPITYAKLRKDDFQEPGRPLARYAGIEEAINQGLLRKAEQTDIQEYLALEARKMDLPEHIINGTLHGCDGWGSRNTYVVLSPDFAIPPGFDGAYQINFILPEGIPRPPGDIGRGLILSFDEVRTRTAPNPQVIGIDVNPDFLSDTSAACGFPDLQLPPAFKVYAAGNYFGRKLNTVTSTNGPDYLMEITVNSPTEPVVLFLGSSCRAIWHLSWTKDTKIAAVFVSGNKKQDIIGLPENVPVKINDEFRKNGCPWFAVNPRIYNLVTINTLSRQFFGKDLDGVFFAEDGRAVVGEPLKENEQLESGQMLNWE